MFRSLSSTDILKMVMSVSARSKRVMASKSACFSGGSKGQAMASEVTRLSSGAFSTADQSLSRPDPSP